MINFSEMIRQIDPKGDYTVSEISDIMCVHRSTLMGHIKRESFPARMIFGKYYIKGKDVWDYYEGKM